MSMHAYVRLAVELVERGRLAGLVSLGLSSSSTVCTAQLHSSSVEQNEAKPLADAHVGGRALPVLVNRVVPAPLSPPLRSPFV